ncbi:hypothetical protein KAS50_09500, partial [bacterium]|nr:hypothetical protein [bacterium]
YKWEGEKFNEVKVEIGLESTNRVEIVSGLTEGDEVSIEAGKKFKEFHKREKKKNEEVDKK